MPRARALFFFVAFFYFVALVCFVAFFCFVFRNRKITKVRYLCWVSRNGDALSRSTAAAIMSQQKRQQQEQRQLPSTTFPTPGQPPSPAQPSNSPGADGGRDHVLRLLSLPDGELSLEDMAWWVQYCGFRCHVRPVVSYGGGSTVSSTVLFLSPTRTCCRGV